MNESIIDKQMDVHERAKKISQTDPFELLNRYIGHTGKRLKVKYRMKNRDEQKQIYLPQEF